MSQEYFETSTKKPRGRGMAQKSLDLIEAMYDIAEAAEPITGRGIGYKLFTANLIPSMERASMKRVYRLLKEARERGIIPWEWIVDETRELERPQTWANPEAYVRAVRRSYRRDFWRDQPNRVMVASEKGTVRGVLAPILDELGVGFQVMHGFSSATTAHDIAEDYDGRHLSIIYVGDYDPSGMYMSEKDLPNRIDGYGGNHVLIYRIAILRQDLDDLSTFPASDKKKDPRYEWFVRNYGNRCCEIDALDPNDLRHRVEEAIKNEIEWEAWERCATVERAEQESMRTFLDEWARLRDEAPEDDE
jgi:hypothetical protein